MTMSIRNLHNLNVIVFGRSGVGKSTLINSVLEKPIALTGVGQSVPREFQVCTKENCHLTLIDTPSIELDIVKKVNLKKEIQNIIRQRDQTNDTNQKIHCIWYCIKSGTGIIDEVEKQYFSIFNNIPIIFIITRSFESSATSKTINILKSVNINSQRIVPILAEDEVFSDFTPPIVKKKYGYNELVNYTAAILPKDIKNIYLHYYFTSLINPGKVILNKCNVIVLGKSGVGKSTLINELIGVEAAESGIGKPITQKIEIFENETSQFSLFDTPGFELDEKNNQKLKKNIINIVYDRFKTKNMHKFIHCIWYCVRGSSRRIEVYEKNFIESISKSTKSMNIPIYIVLTQCFYDDFKEMIESINKLNMKIKKIIPIVAKKEELKDFKPPKIIEPFGVDNLTEETLKNMPS